MMIKHWIFDLIDSLVIWKNEHDICQVCGEGTVTKRCYEGCGKRICEDCESYFYEDATICIECRAAITPEEEAGMRKEAADALEEECICPVATRIGTEKNNPDCELSEDEHEAITNYRKAQVAQ